MKGSEITLAIIGGGVYVVPLLCQLSKVSDIPRLQVRLSATDRPRLGIIARHARRCVQRTRQDWVIRAVPTNREAMSAADVIVLLARIGGSAARAHDESFPQRFGCIGDEGLGLGGVANAWRTFPPLETIARAAAELAPGARVLNLMAPLPLTTRLLREFGLDAIGLCELPTTVERRIGAGHQLDYLGINHLGWFWPSARSNGAVLADAVEARWAHPHTIDEFGAIPLPYYYRVWRPDLGRSLGITAPVGRAYELEEVTKRIFEQMASGSRLEISEFEVRKTPWFDLALVPTLRAFAGGSDHHGFVNTGEDAWDGRIGPAGTVLECRAVFSGSSVCPRPPRLVPHAVRSFLELQAVSADQVYRACRIRDESALRRAVASVGSVAGLHLDHAVREIQRPVGDTAMRARGVEA